MISPRNSRPGLPRRQSPVRARAELSQPILMVRSPARSERSCRSVWPTDRMTMSRGVAVTVLRSGASEARAPATRCAPRTSFSEPASTRPSPNEANVELGGPGQGEGHRVGVGRFPRTKRIEVLSACAVNASSDRTGVASPNEANVELGGSGQGGGRRVGVSRFPRTKRIKVLSACAVNASSDRAGVASPNEANARHSPNEANVELGGSGQGGGRRAGAGRFPRTKRIEVLSACAVKTSSGSVRLASPNEPNLRNR